MRVLTTKLRVEIENETRVFLESLDFKIHRDESLAEVLPQGGLDKTRPNKTRAVSIWQERVHSSFPKLNFLALGKT